TVLGPSPGVTGVTDRLGAPINGNQSFSFTTTTGPTVANNPVTPNCVYFGAVLPSRFGVIGSNNVTDSQGIPVNIVDSNHAGFPDVFEANFASRTPENTFVGPPVATAVGAWIPPGNTIATPPFPNPPAPQPITSTATTVPSICGIPPVFIPNSS